MRMSCAPPSESSTSRTRPARSSGFTSWSASADTPPRPGSSAAAEPAAYGWTGIRCRVVIARYTRPELGALWTDEAKMQAWRDVEVAAAEALDGPTDADLEAIRAATFTVEAVQE